MKTYDFANRLVSHVIIVLIVLLTLSGCATYFDNVNDIKDKNNYAAPENISQLLHCLAIVNGATDNNDEMVAEEVTCPNPGLYKPIRFSKGSSLNQPAAVGALAALLQSESAKKLKYRLVGHSDNTGSPKDKYKVSLRRAQKLQGTLKMLGVPGKRLLAEGRGDSEPFGNTQDTFAINGSSEGGCLYGDTVRVNYNCRVEVEVVTPVVARYGALPSDRKASSLISSENGPHVRFFPHGLTPGRVVSVDVGKIDIPDFSPVWNPREVGKDSKWKEVKPSGSLFDNNAGKLWARLRWREVVRPPSYWWKKRSKPTVHLIVDLAATAKSPVELPAVSFNSHYPDYWALLMRLSSHSENVPNDELAAIISEIGIEDKVGAKFQCDIGNALKDHVPMHGDDRLAQVYGVNAWTLSFDLKNGMSFCTDYPLYMFNSYNNRVYPIEQGRLTCIELEEYFINGKKLLSFSTGHNSIGHLFPKAKMCPSSNRITRCDEFKNNQQNGISIVTNLDELGCFGARGSYRVFTNLRTDANISTPGDYSYIIAADSDVAMNQFSSIIRVKGAGNNTVIQECNNKKDIVKCAQISWWTKMTKMNNQKLSVSGSFTPSFYASFKFDQLDQPIIKVPLGDRLQNLKYLSRQGNKETDISIQGQVDRQFSSNVIVEHSDTLLEQWPIIQTGEE